MYVVWCWRVSGECESAEGFWELALLAARGCRGEEVTAGVSWGRLCSQKLRFKSYISRGSGGRQLFLGHSVECRSFLFRDVRVYWGAKDGFLGGKDDQQRAV